MLGGLQLCTGCREEAAPEREMAWLDQQEDTGMEGEQKSQQAKAVGLGLGLIRGAASDADSQASLFQCLIGGSQRMNRRLSSGQDRESPALLGLAERVALCHAVPTTLGLW